jgi:hypothetical protein
VYCKTLAVFLDCPVSFARTCVHTKKLQKSHHYHITAPNGGLELKKIALEAANTGKPNEVKIGK